MPHVQGPIEKYLPGLEFEAVNARTIAFRCLEQAACELAVVRAPAPPQVFAHRVKNLERAVPSRHAIDPSLVFREIDPVQQIVRHRSSSLRPDHSRNPLRASK